MLLTHGVLLAAIHEAVSEDAAEGTKLHEHLNPTVGVEDLNEEQLSRVLWAREHMVRCFRGLAPSGFEIPVIVWYEGKPVTWGSLDAATKNDRHGIVYDAKFSRIPPVREGVAIQMAAYACGWMQEHDLDRCEVWVGYPRQEIEFHDVYTDAKEIASHINEIITYALEHPNEFHPSSTACRYCKAQIACPEFKKEVLEELPAILDRLQVLEPERFPELLEKLPILERFIRDARDCAKKMIRMGVEIPGYTIRDKRVRKIVDVEAAFTAASCLEQSEFLKCCDVVLGDLEDAYKRKAVALGECCTQKEALEVLNLRLKQENAIEVRIQTQLARKEED